jgi:predicted ATPase
MRRHGYGEAIEHLRRGIDLVQTLPDSPDRTQQELALQILLGVLLMTTRGFAAPEVEHAYARARTLCQQMGNIPQLFPVLMGLWVFHFVRAELSTAREISEQLLHLAHNAQDPALLLEAHNALGHTLFHLGELVAAQSHLEQAIACYDPQQHRSHALQYGQDPAVVCYTYVAFTQWLLGSTSQALRSSNKAIALAHSLAHPHSLVFALAFTAVLHQYRGEATRTHEQVEAILALATDYGFAMFTAMGALLRMGGGYARATTRGNLTNARRLSGVGSNGSCSVVAILACSTGRNMWKDRPGQRGIAFAG